MKPKLDRTTLNRKNSAFSAFFEVLKSEKLRFLREDFALFLCCYCIILIKYLSSSSKYRIRLFNIDVNSGVFRNFSDIVLKLRVSGKAQKPQDARPSLRFYALPRSLVGNSGKVFFCVHQSKISFYYPILSVVNRGEK
jgi:hypothetical protein